jgi:hypothetical protein
MLQFARHVSNDMIKGFPEDKRTFQACPTDNHLTWVLGHVASTEAWLGRTMNIPGTAVPETYGKLFGGGSKPLPDPKAYPTLAEIRKVFDEGRAATIKWLQSAPDAALAVSLKDATGGFANDPVDAALKMAWHEGWHFGQVANCRKALGLPNAMG